MKKLITLSMFFMACSLFAQEETPEKKLSISGSIDAYYRANLTSPNNLGSSSDSPGTSFAQLPGFALGMANVIFAYEGEKTGFVADLVFGPRGTDAIFNSPQYSRTGDIVNQLYAYWNVSDAVTLTMGNFNTFLGYEVISPVGNFNYSTSYLFTNGPFSHTGLKADIALSEDFSLMLGVMNNTDLTEFNPNGSYALGAQLGYSGQFLNFLYDDAGLGFEVDYTGGFDLSDTVFLGINAAYQTKDDAGFHGAALYPQLAASEALSVGIRAEYFGFHVKNVDDIPSVLGLTLTGSYAVENLTIKPEVRFDTWSNDFEPFMNNSMDPASSLASFVLAAIYSF